MLATLKTLVLKTATVTGVKLVTPADRIGLGFGVAAYPTDNLSPGQIPMPHNPEPELVRSREELSAPQSRQQLHAGGETVPPGGSAGCLPGLTATRFAPASASPLTRSWRAATRTAAAGGTREGLPVAVPGSADFSRDLGRTDRFGRDCQSLRRFRDLRGAKREVGPAAAAGK
ncbi:hypothetical protein [Gemmata sp.]|uniref:hypothetical protein n=1 Tax=Gemmata sp. TaxID=1914242 RepID=UPI003F7093A6